MSADRVRSYRKLVKGRLFVPLPDSSNNDEDYNEPFDIKEMISALSYTDSTAPGEDEIHCDILKYLLEVFMDFFFF